MRRMACLLPTTYEELARAFELERKLKWLRKLPAT
jgi:hypothetical protein